MHNNVQLSIITVGMNHLYLIKDYLNSLFVSCKPKVEFELIYIDNCSKDGSVSFIKSNFPCVRVFQNRKIKGFASNNNFGVRHAKGKYILILNPDVVLLPGSVDRLYEYINRNSNIGIVVPKLLNSDLSLQSSVRKFITPRIAILRFFNSKTNVSRSKLIRGYLQENFDAERIQPIDWALGAAMIIKSEWFSKLGGFDEKYFLYVEDVDLCLNSWKEGGPVIYYPHSVFVHAHQRASGRLFNKARMFHIKSMVRFFWKHKIIFRPLTFSE